MCEFYKQERVYRVYRVAFWSQRYSTTLNAESKLMIQHLSSSAHAIAKVGNRTSSFRAGYSASSHGTASAAAGDECGDHVLQEIQELLRQKQQRALFLPSFCNG